MDPAVLNPRAEPGSDCQWWRPRENPVRIQEQRSIPGFREDLALQF